jgi:hypothetical protein
MHGSFDIEFIKENEDGSADYFIHMNEETHAAFARVGLMMALQQAIEDAKKLNPGVNDDVQ